MSKKQKEQKPLTPEQAAKRADGIAVSEKRRKEREAQKAAAKEQAAALAKWTADKCPELLLAGEIQQEFFDLNAKITAKLDIFTSKAGDAKLAFDDLIPDLDIMQAMLSQRGRYRKLMDTLGLPTWTAWFKDFEKRCALEYSLKTVQRRLKEYRGELGEEPKPEPSIYEDLFKRLNALVPSWSDGVEHVLVDRLDTVTCRIADNHGDGLTELEKNYLNYSIMTLEEIARDFAAYAAALKKKWTGREQWLSEKEEDKQSRFAALKGEPEESKSDIRAEQDESLP